MTSPNQDPRGGGFTIEPRDLLVLIISIIAGIAAGMLLMDSGALMGQATIGGFAAFGASFYLVDKITKR